MALLYIAPLTNCVFCRGCRPHPLKACRYEADCHAFQRICNGSERLDDRCHNALFLHPPSPDVAHSSSADAQVVDMKEDSEDEQDSDANQVRARVRHVQGSTERQDGIVLKSLSLCSQVARSCDGDDCELWKEILAGGGSVEALYHISEYHRGQRRECEDGRDCAAYQRLEKGNIASRAKKYEIPDKYLEHVEGTNSIHTRGSKAGSRA